MERELTLLVDDVDHDRRHDPLHVMSDRMVEKERELKERVLEKAGPSTWVWHSGKPMPALPSVIVGRNPRSQPPSPNEHGRRVVTA